MALQQRAISWITINRKRDEEDDDINE